MTIPVSVKLRFLPVAIAHRVLTWTRGNQEANKRIRDLLYSVALKDLNKRFGKQESLEDVHRSLEIVYSTAGKHQKVDIAVSPEQISVTTRECVFHRACTWYGIPEVTPALCAADRDFWASRWPAFTKQNQFELGGSMCHATWGRT
jgi:hypothetical protein